MNPGPTLGALRNWAIAALTEASPSPVIDADRLLTHATGTSAASIRAFPERIPAVAARQQFASWIARRRRGEPVAYILGECGFMDLDLAIDRRALIPRPETEHLVEAARAVGGQQILDAGTGSGCIAIALARARPDAAIDAVDRSADAVALARANAERLGTPWIRFLIGNWYAPLGGRRYDVIVANPPYIGASEPEIDQGDLRYEPREALIAEAEGLAALQALIGGAPDHLTAGGWLWLEHGNRQAGAVRELLQTHGFGAIESRRDLAGWERVTGGRRQGEAR